MSRALVASVIAALLISAPLAAQDARGSIVGRVTDASGAVVPNAEVRAINAATGVAASTRSNEAGNYTLPYLIPGLYTVSSETTGFKKFIRENVQVRVNDVVQVNIEMSIGAVSEAIEVTAETPLLTTTEASLGQVVDERRVNELPLFAGNAMDLVHLTPGIMNGTDMRLRKAPFNAAPSQFSTDGSGNNSNEFTIDGVSNTYSDGTAPRVAFSPPAAAIAEFRVQTTPYDAQVGHTQGALVNVSTKGGTNELHGSAWWWLRHSKLDTPTVFQNRSGQKLPIYQDNRYGVSSGAPVIIPGVYNGKNKTFWQFTWEANKFGDPNVGASTGTVPRAAWRNGDFSDLLRIGSNYQLYDPATIRAEANGRFSRQPFAGNVIPTSRLNPVGKAIINLYPLPNSLSTETVDGRNNWFLSGKALEDYWTTIGRVDHAFSEKNRMFVRFHRDYWQEDKNRTFGNDLRGIILNRVNRGIAFDDVHVFGPSFLVNFRYGLTQQEFPERRVSRGFDLSSLGFSSNLTNLVDPELAAIPDITVDSLTRLSQPESGDGTTASLTHSFSGNFTYLKGDHNIRFGPELRVYREFRNRFTNDVAPLFDFNAWGRGPLDNSPVAPVGAEMVSLLLGIPNGSMTRSGSYAEQDKYFGLYVQDDWKVSRKLTLNVGLRIEHESPITERFNRAAVHFAADQSNPIEAQARANYGLNPISELPLSDFQVRGGLTFAGVDGNSREYWNGQSILWMPRIGFAYSMNDKTVLRGGYGWFYGSIGVNKTNSNLAGFSQSTPMQPTLDNGLTFIASLENPFPNGLLEPKGATGGLTTNLGQGLGDIYPDKRLSPYSQKWSFTVQRQLPESFVVQMSYVGNRATRVPVRRNINATPLEYLSKSPTRDQATISYLGANVKSPFYGLNSIYGQNITRGNLLKPYPHFGDIFMIEPMGYSWFHSMQTQVERRWARGFTFQMAYTWSKAMEAMDFLNAADTLPYESLAGIDRPHRIVGSGQWELPYGHKRKWGADANRVVNFVLGGWQLNGMFQRQSGAPLGFEQALFIGDSSTIALPSDQRNTDKWFNTSVFVRDNTQQLASNVRTSPLRYSNVRADSQRRLDLSLIKYFHLNERMNFQFRAETFNAMNTVVLRTPNTDPYNSTFGRVTAQEPPRSWQMSLRLAW